MNELEVLGMTVPRVLFIYKNINSHASPLEHQATPSTYNERHLWGNLFGWTQYRKIWEQEIYSK